jgi:hypothetical protein
MPSRNITVPVSDSSPEAVGRTRDPGNRERAGSVPIPSGQNLASKQQQKARLLVSPPVVGYSCSALEWPPFQEAVEVLVCRVGPGLAMLVSKRKTKVLVCIGLQLQVDGST